MIAQTGSELPGRPGCLPSSTQRLLLQAACLEAGTASTAWKEWRRRNDPASADPFSARILPWIYHRRGELALSQTDLHALEPAYRFAWLKNQRLLNSAASVIRMLRAEGIELLLLKGLPLLIEACRDEGARYMEDFDVMLRDEDVERAIQILSGSGWRAMNCDDFSPATRRWRHSSELVHESGLQCDIHWRLLRRPYEPVNENPAWDAKRAIAIREISASTLSVEYTLVHLMAHGMSWQRVSPARWILDLNLLLRRHTPDWNLVLAEGARRGVTHAVREALAAYDSVVPGQLPAWLTPSVFRIPTSRRQRLAYAQLAGPYHEASLRVKWAIYNTSLAEAQTRGLIRPGLRGVIGHFYDYWLRRFFRR